MRFLAPFFTIALVLSLTACGGSKEAENTELPAVELTVSAAASLTDALQEIQDIGIPESVPAGKYAQQALTNAGVWEELQAKMVQAKDVRQVLQYVETGNAEAAKALYDYLQTKEALDVFVKYGGRYSDI